MTSGLRKLASGKGRRPLAVIAIFLASSVRLAAEPLPAIASFEMKKTADEQRAVTRDPKAAWIRQVVARINVKMPQLNKRLKNDLKVEVGFVVARDGQLVSKAIARSSGIADLDATVLAMLDHAAPFPPMPAAMNDQRLSFNLPLRFH